ncbi:DUF536 domain-containing protein [Enterococcus sp. HY326]|uniref:DUF536 domain-containing protein n=1 Tax=Enterococcus sp. HY326 TaxID=2971265 RepID=UPI00223ECA71|nr:DUF536 domain-containing protein [Enterococcus sp. HY326]
MENYKTIKELADEIDYSKQAIQKIIEGLSVSERPNKRGNKYILFEDDQVRIKRILGIDNSDNDLNILDIESDNSNIKTNKLDNSDKDRYIKFLESENDNKILRIEKLEKLVDQQQQLTLQANKQIEQLQSQLLVTYTEESRRESKEEVEQQLSEASKEEIPELSKKWFQFWK